MVEIHVQRTIAAPVERVFDWLADPVNLATAPLVLKSAWSKDTKGPGVGAVREVLGTGMWFREDITAYDRPHSYSYLIVGAFPAFDHDGGTLTFTPSGSSSGEGTHVDWLTNYTHPVHAGGKLMQLVSRPLLRVNFLAILAACDKALVS
ncbi:MULTISPECIES: SRPBCC family protein [unclassified Mycobacterium]|uniref:SRPBCC family protein n=1 Tax=unclassified Mycobacterium TaxID=2642494 RepID=UPI0027406669|nr:MULTISPECIES: SRPBCC family protein [unclassified Mycobacterium]MDP7701258.1 SRPBCC family protein [Mycobacterium sp. TY815]MDP7724123.1 SRPBCC family protein [Mycobacterium sp. TY814]